MAWSIRRSLCASLFCASLVIVRENEVLSEGIFGTVRFLWFPPVYLIRLRKRDDKATFMHEVWHVRLMDWSRHEAKKAPLLRLRKTCRKIADSDLDLADLLRNFYDRTLGVDAIDEPVVRLIERPDLHVLLSQEDRDLLFRLQRAAWLDLRTYWFHWFVILALVHWVVVSV